MSDLKGVTRNGYSLFLYFKKMTAIFATIMRKIFIAAAIMLVSVTAASAQDKDFQTLRKEADGTVVVNTSYIGRDIDGFAGTVPVEIYIKDGKVSAVVPLENEETPAFFEKAKTLLSKWTGLKVKDALELEVDASTGASYSSKALVSNVRRGLEYYLDSGKKK